MSIVVPATLYCLPRVSQELRAMLFRLLAGLVTAADDLLHFGGVDAGTLDHGL